MKRFILTTHENYGKFISSIQRIRNSRKPPRTHVRSWKHQLLLLCPVKLSKIVEVMHQTKFKQNLRVFWKLMNPQKSVWKIRYRSIMKTILQEKVRIHCNITIWLMSLFLCLHEDPGSESSSGQKMGKNWKNFRHGTWRKSEVRKKWSMKQTRCTLQFILYH